MSRRDLDRMWARHSAEWRDGSQITSQWREAARVDAGLLEMRTRGRWRETLATLGITLLVTREYEHLVMAMNANRTSYLPLPHPSGLVVDRDRAQVHIASTRNPNQVYLLRPIVDSIERADLPRTKAPTARCLTPVSSSFYPGCLYLHDLALLRGRLHGSATGQNAVVSLCPGGGFERVWWPSTISEFSRNTIQLNSIAAGATLAKSYFSASSSAPGRLRPGHLNYPVDGRGVIFSGATGEPICTGLTRPHSARLHEDRVWVNNSGYGEFGFASQGGFTSVRSFPGWTRGLCLVNHVAFVGVSRVIPKYARYAPGLDLDRSECGVCAVDTRNGAALGSVVWPSGNQIFAIDWIQETASSGFLFARGRSRNHAPTFYTFLTSQDNAE